ncbi:MAG: hypothetical protein LBT49_00575 [Prevotellaceae bacterium]|nr:hypothetical protein [Prevotellaceae bacterium]
MFAQGHQSMVVAEWSSFTIKSVAAATSGSGGTVAYQWLENGAPVPGATDAAFFCGMGRAAGDYEYVRLAKTPDCGNAWMESNVFTVHVQCRAPLTFASFALCGGEREGSSWMLTDERDGKQYRVVLIDTFLVMAENLNYQGTAAAPLVWNQNSKEANGKPFDASAANGVPAIGSFWCPATHGATLTSSSATCNVYGALYTWETAMALDGLGTWTELATYNTGAANEANSKFNHGRTAPAGTGAGGRGICPERWHVPTEFEWGVLFDAMEGGGSGTIHQTAPGIGVRYGIDAGAKAKSTGTCASGAGTCATDTDAKWDFYGQSVAGADLYGFRVLPTGSRTVSGTFTNRGGAAFFWSSSVYSSTNAWIRYFSCLHIAVSRGYQLRSYGSTVRCIRD